MREIVSLLVWFYHVQHHETFLLELMSDKAFFARYNRLLDEGEKCWEFPKGSRKVIVPAEGRRLMEPGGIDQETKKDGIS